MATAGAHRVRPAEQTMLLPRVYDTHDGSAVELGEPDLRFASGLYRRTYADRISAVLSLLVPWSLLLVVVVAAGWVVHHSQ
jgi:hypothetical protein